MFTGHVGPVEVFFYWPETVLGDFYWPGAIGLPLASSPVPLQLEPQVFSLDRSNSALQSGMNYQTLACHLLAELVTKFFSQNHYQAELRFSRKFWYVCLE